MRWLERREPGVGERLVRAAPRVVRRDPERASVLTSYGALLEGTVPRHVVVVGAPQEELLALAVAFAKTFSAARVTALVGAVGKLDQQTAAPPARVELLACRSLGSAHEALLHRPPPDVVVDHGGTPASLRFKMFSHLFPALADGGRWLLRDGGGTAAPALQDREGETLPHFVRRLRALGDGSDDPDFSADEDDRHRATMVGDVVEHDSVTAVTKAGVHLAKVREEEADTVLPARLGSRWGAVLEKRPDREFVSRAALTTSSAGPDMLANRFDVPPRTLRVQNDVLCLPRQLAVAGDTVLPASFHHPEKARLQNRGSIDTARWYAAYLSDPGEVPTLPGTWYYLASEFPGHFGHVMTEDLSRLWGWDRALDEFPDLRLLAGAGDPPPPLFERQLLAAFGIAPGDLCSPSTPVRVERLVTATPQLHNGRYVDPDIADTWDRVAAGSVQPGAAGPRRIFVTRPAGSIRACLNGPELESRFTQAGFVLVRPETMTIGEQLTLFAGADVVAGYGGSGLFSALATPPGATMIVIASDSYTAVNEWLISAVRGFDHHQLWCPSQRPRGERFARASFHAPFSFDFARDGATLDHLLSSLA